MQWPPWSNASSSSSQAPPTPSPSPPPRNEDNDRKPIPWSSLLNAPDFTQYLEPRNLVPTVLLTSTILLTIHIQRSYLRRIPDSHSIRPSFFRRRSLFGTVTRVGDADNFHLYHTPGGRWAGWGWFPGRKVPEAGAGGGGGKKGGSLKGNTIHIRIAGIDAPESSHFGKPAQPFSAEALAWLRSYILHRRVRAYIYKRDQYERVVATVWVRKWGGLIRKDVGREMLKAGLATVYEAKAGAEFGEWEERYRTEEGKAKRWRRGMWSAKEEEFESPRAFKTRMKSEGEGK